MAYLEIKNLKKDFGSLEVLKGIDLSIERNTVVSLVGGSGNGKTTLLRCLIGLEEPTAGEVLLNDENIYQNRKLMKNFGFVFQSFNLFPQYTVLKNVTLALDVNAKSKEKKDILEANRAKGMELLRKLGLEEKANCYPYELSGGQKQRVAIARALALEPSILLFDEPTSALDPKTTRNVAEIIKDLKKDFTVIVVTHDVEFAQAISDKLIFLNEGIIEFEGTYDEFVSSSDQKIIDYLGNAEE